MKFVRVLLLFVALLLCCFKAALGQTWQLVTTTGAPTGAGVQLLLTDGSVLVHQMMTSGWYKLTPDSAGNYATGTWSRVADMPADYGPLYFSSAVLKDGRVVVVGGEYNFGSAVWTTKGAIYDPIANTWTALPPPTGFWYGGDMQCAVMPDGKFLLAHILDTQMAELDPATLTWSSVVALGKSDRFDEEGWTLLPDGTILTVDAINNPQTEKYIPWLYKWIPCGATPNPLAEANSQEVGPAVLMNDGRVFATGARGWNALWTPGPTPMSPGTWTSAPMFPTVAGGQLDIADGPACLLPNGKAFCVASPGVFNSDSHFFEFDGTNLTEVTRPANASFDPSYVFNFLVLPNGQVLTTDFSSDIEVYTSAGTPDSTWRPTVTGCPTNITPGTTFTLTGTQLNGRSQSSGYGDDSTNAVNYPLVRITNIATGHVKYCRTSHHSTMAVATGSRPVTTQVYVPNGIELGDSRLEVVANGIASAPFMVTLTGGSTNPIIHSITPGRVFVNPLDAPISISGQNFGSTDQVQIVVAGIPVNIPTTFVSANVLKATIPSANIQSPATAQIRVVTTGGASSNDEPLPIYTSPPTLGTVSPGVLIAGSADQTLTITGSLFRPGDVVQWTNSSFPVDLVTTYVSPTQLTATFPASLMTGKASGAVRVTDPEGQSSIYIPLSIAGNEPLISSVTPSSVKAGGPDLTVTFSGVQFKSGDVAQWIDGVTKTPLTTTFVSATQVTAVIPASLMTTTKYNIFLNVKDPNNQESNNIGFTLESNIPELTDMSPNSVQAGGPDITITLTGLNFIPGDVVQWDDGAMSDLVTTYVSPTQLTAVIPASSMQTTRSANVNVRDPYGQQSFSLFFDVSTNAPEIWDVSPADANVGDPDTSITITGIRFASNDVVKWSDGITTEILPSAFVDTQTLTATIPASLLTDGNAYNIWVEDAFGQQSSQWMFFVNNPVPTITRLSPGGGVQGHADMTITVSGVGFVPSSVVEIISTAGSMSPLVTTFVSSNTLTAVIPKAQFDNVGAAFILVNNPNPGGGNSYQVPFLIENDVVLSSVTPGTITVYQPTTLTINGTGFLDGAVLKLGRETIRARSVTSTQVIVDVPGRQNYTAGTVKIQISNPGGVLSDTLDLNINSPVPTITSLSPSQVTHGAAAFTMSVMGTGFTNKSVVRWAGTNQTTTFVSSHELRISVPASKVATAGTAAITVRTSNPGGGTSNSVNFKIN